MQRPVHAQAIPITEHITGTELSKNIKLLLIATFVYITAWGILDPFMPLYIKSIAGNYTLTGIIFALLNLFIFFIAIPIGDLSDKTKPNRLIKISLLLYPIIGIAYGFSAKLWQLTIARFLHGIANPLFWVSDEAFIRQNTTKQNNLKAFGWYPTVKSFGIIIGAVLGAIFITIFGLKNLNDFFFILIPVSIISLLVFSKIKGEKDVKDEKIEEAIEEVVKKDRVFKKEFKDFLSLGKTAVILALLVVFSAIIANILYFVVPLVSEKINLGLAGLALLYGIINVPFAFCFLFAGLADREGKIQIIEIGTILTAIVLAMLGFSLGSLAIFVVLCFALAFLLALVIPSINSIISDITPNVEMGEITGIYYAMFFLGSTIGPIIFGLIADCHSLEATFLVTAAIAFELFAIIFFYRKKIKE